MVYGSFLGHAILEMAIVLFLLLGFSFVLTNLFVVRTIGIAGGFLLIFFGISTIRNVYLGKISTRFPTSLESENRETVVSCDGVLKIRLSEDYGFHVQSLLVGLVGYHRIGVHDSVRHLIQTVAQYWFPFSWGMNRRSCLVPDSFGSFFLGLQRLNKKVYYGS